MTIALIPLAARARPAVGPGPSLPTHSIQSNGNFGAIRYKPSSPGLSRRRYTESFWYRSTAGETGPRNVTSVWVSETFDSSPYEITCRLTNTHSSNGKLDGFDDPYTWNYEVTGFPDNDWAHFVLHFDADTGTMEIYRNAVQLTKGVSVGPPVEDQLGGTGNGIVTHFLLGNNLSFGGGVGYRGELYDYYRIDDELVAATELGQGTPGDGGTWYPKKYAVTQGGHSWNLDFEIDGMNSLGNDLGTDVSGNAHHFDTSTTARFADGVSQTNNHPTFAP